MVFEANKNHLIIACLVNDTWNKFCWIYTKNNRIIKKEFQTRKNRFHLCWNCVTFEILFLPGQNHWEAFRFGVERNDKINQKRKHVRKIRYEQGSGTRKFQSWGHRFVLSDLFSLFLNISKIRKINFKLSAVNWSTEIPKISQLKYFQDEFNIHISKFFKSPHASSI